MGKVLVPLLVVAAGTLVWSDNATRTAKLEILRSPTKVAIWKPDPYPILRSYGDELRVAALNNRTTPATNQTSSMKVEKEINNDEGSPHNSTEVSNSTMSTHSPKNMTCIRRDYEDDLAAVFEEEAGPIETAYLVFNSTGQPFEGIILNTTDLSELNLLNETIVDCGMFKLNSTGIDHP